jgi:hypothetical protein
MKRGEPYFAGFCPDVTVANRLRFKFRDLSSRFRRRSVAILPLGDAPDELQHDLAAMRASAVLDQVNRLPCTQGKLPAKHRHI